MAYKMIQIGLGAMGRDWCQTSLPPNIKEGLIEVVAAVDIDPGSLRYAQELLGLPADQCYTDIKKALDRNPADFCTIVVPPAAHEAVVDLALHHDLHILSEKPIADSLAASVRIADKVKRAGVKMGVTMSHRYDQDKTTLRQELRSGRYGRLDYLVYHLTSDLRKFGSWGKFRHQIPHPLMVEGAVHQLDIIADLAGAKCDTIYSQSWNPPWGEYAGDTQALVTLSFENDSRAFFEGACTNAVGLKDWTRETIRAECELGTLVLMRAVSSVSATTHAAADHQSGRRRRGNPAAGTAQVDEYLVDRAVRTLAGWRRSYGDPHRSQSPVGGANLRSYRK